MGGARGGGRVKAYTGVPMSELCNRCKSDPAWAAEIIKVFTRQVSSLKDELKREREKQCTQES